jgi:outer membrane protein OmpA-like peptidoglycan-associated protein
MVRTMIRQQLLLLLVTPLLLAGLVTPAAAQNVVMLQDNASVCAIFQALSPDGAPQCSPRTRSIVMQPATPRPAKHDATASRAETAPAPAAAPSKPARVYAFATRIQFAYDSAQFASEAYPILDNVAQVLKDGLMTDKIIRIEGHTDSAGSEAYNLRLSTHRALAVQRYLHTVHGIPLQRIPTVGKGEDELYTPDQPLDAANRRVQFVNLTDSPAR